MEKQKKNKKNKQRNQISTNLDFIRELTEENQSNQQSQQTNITSIVDKDQSCYEYILQCIRFMYQMMVIRKKNNNFIVNKEQIPKFIKSINKTKKYEKNVIGSNKTNKRSLILDLDETLVYTTYHKPNKYDFKCEINFNNKITNLYTIKRFGLDNFIYEMSQYYEIIIFTAGKQYCADKIINQIDQKNRISYRLYRQHCIIINGSIYLKNLRILGRNLQDCIIVDDNSLAGVLQPDNFYYIDKFLGNSKDRKLIRLSAYLKYIYNKQNFLPVKQSRQKFEIIEIQIDNNTFITNNNNCNKQFQKHKKSSSQIKFINQEQDKENYEFSLQSLKIPRNK